MNLKLTAACFTIGVMLLLASPARMSAETPRIQRLEVVQAGFMTARRTGATTEAPGSAAGFMEEADRMVFLPEPPADTARVGTVFGLKFRVIGQPLNAPAKLRAIWRIPAPGITNPKTGNTYRQDVTELTVSIGEERTRAFGFDEPWEIARGTWTLELWQDDRKLIEQNFTVQ